MIQFTSVYVALLNSGLCDELEGCHSKNHVLFQLPEELLSIKGTLRTLDLSVNRLTVLPPSLGEFTNLRTLNLAQNRLSKPV